MIVRIIGLVSLVAAIVSLAVATYPKVKNDDWYYWQAFALFLICAAICFK